MSAQATAHRTAATHAHRGLKATEHYLDVPLDHGDPSGEQITVFAREIVSTDVDDPAALPWLLFLQGGPGGAGPRISSLSGWIGEAAKSFRVLLLDQRGTGLSAPVNRQSLPVRGGVDAQVAYLRHFRADSIVRDAEALRRALGVDRWTTLGQSYGGFITLSYLSLAPEGLERCLVTGGLAAVTGHADRVYRHTYARMAARNAEYFGWYPEDRDTLDRVFAHVDEVAEVLPDGRPVTRGVVQMLGQYFGGNSRVHQLHFALEQAFVETADGPRLSDAFLGTLYAQASRLANPLYALMHESIYGQGTLGRNDDGSVATAWAAERVAEEFADFLPAAERPLLTGEMVYPWFFSADPALVPLREAAEALAGVGDWPDLYDLDVLATNTVPVAAAVYSEDVYVDRELSLETASRVRGLRVWETADFHHDGIADDGAGIFARLLSMTMPESKEGAAR
ncbi:alpha/beta fold hydrolase [Zhihengliuella salsuginis]|uniref:Alpha/beta hydrolase n=1 Tax=Zhihengliuella salsuginis TaxID=578222 RepID=A0ABQ3GDX0_9MICC|nr:alpha/beta fold hydrolase [Zhihengliuella salsuginis]GHD01524.1 alpha/beta hydrolase [Zhihengliuella salsuginis]